MINIAKAKGLFEYFTEISGSDKKPDIVQRLLKNTIYRQRTVCL